MGRFSKRDEVILRAYAARRMHLTEAGERATEANTLAAAALDAAGLEAPSQALEPEDLPPVTENALEFLLQEAAAAPPEVNVGQYVTDGSVSRTTYLSALNQLRGQFNAPPATLERMLLEPITFERSFAPKPPKDWRFPAWSAALTPAPESYQVENHLFETLGDLWGWIVNCGKTKLPDVAEANRLEASRHFRWAEDAASKFRYPMPPSVGAEPVQVALFADFGTGLVHSRYIARQLATLGAPFAIHLGDVYYAGRREEYQRYFVEPLRDLVSNGKTQLFNIAGNHDQFSGNRWYWQDIRDRQANFKQIQEGSYFLLYNDHYQILGLDTNSFALERYDTPRLHTWLVDALKEGRDKKRTNIVLTSEHAYDYIEGPHPFDHRGPLYHDLDRALAGEGGLAKSGLVDFWIWCHVHYATFNAPAPEKGFPFIGACVGHGGYPYGRRSPPRDAPFIRWVETAPRYPTRLGVRPDMGNNGYCVMELAFDQLKLTYKDWMGYRRCEAVMVRSADGTLRIEGVYPFPEEKE